MTSLSYTVLIFHINFENLFQSKSDVRDFTQTLTDFLTLQAQTFFVLFWVSNIRENEIFFYFFPHSLLKLNLLIFIFKLQLILIRLRMSRSTRKRNFPIFDNISIPRKKIHASPELQNLPQLETGLFYKFDEMPQIGKKAPGIYHKIQTNLKYNYRDRDGGFPKDDKGQFIKKNRQVDHLRFTNNWTCSPKSKFLRIWI